MKRAVSLLLALLLMPASLALAQSTTKHRALVLSCDGAGAEIIQTMLDAGAMPNLKRIEELGVHARYSQTNFASKTAAGHAALWTGTFGANNGVSGNEVPLLPWNEHTILEGRSGFVSENLRAAGKRVIVLDAPLSTPVETFEPGGRFGSGLGDRLTILSGFGGLQAAEGVINEDAGLYSAESWQNLPAMGSLPPLETAFRLDGEPLFGLIYAGPKSTVYDTLLLTRDPSGASSLATLKPESPMSAGAWSEAVPLHSEKGLASVYFRLFNLSPDGKHFMLYHTAPADIATDQAAWLPAFYGAGCGFVSGGGGHIYAKDGLGTPIAEGGDGTAEARYLDTVHFCLSKLAESSRWLIAQPGWDLMVDYFPYPDEMEHMWTGYLMPGQPSYRPDLARKLGPAMRQVFSEVDSAIGSLDKVLPPDAAFVIVSDHGMSGCRYDFKPNVPLRKAGLLVLDAHGQVDLSRTKAMYSENDGAYVVLNTTDHKGGIVTPLEVPAVMAAVKKALAGVMTAEPGSKIPLVSEMLEPTPTLTAQLGIGGAVGGNLYLDLKPGYLFSPEVTGDSPYRLRKPDSSGNHIFDPRRHELHAIFYADGPGFRHGTTIGPVRNIDMAPTVCHYLGVPAPPQATGRILSEALDP
jgi:hypothetical protein